MSIASDYVNTLPHHCQNQFNVIITRKSNGIDMDLVVAMRNNVNITTLKHTLIPNLTRWLNRLTDDFYCRIEAKNKLGLDVIGDKVPLLPLSWIAKGLDLTKAFIWGYLNYQDGLNREMTLLLSSTVLAINHQSQFVCHVK